MEIVDGVIVLTYKSATRHDENDGALHIRFSDDYGATWSDEDKNLVGGAVTGFPMNPPDIGLLQDAGEPWLYTAPNGDLLLHMWRVDYQLSVNGSYQSRSTDGGLTWSAPAAIDFIGIADDTKVFSTDDHFVYDGVIYAGARQYDDAAPTNCKNIFIKSVDNGATWEYVSDISDWTTDTIETGVEYLGNSRIICLLRDKTNNKTYQTYSNDMGATWDTMTDITIRFKASARHRIFTKTHLQGGANWWNDPILIVCGFELTVPGSSHPRRNAIWVSGNAGGQWFGPFYMDAETDDGGYGDMVYDPVNGKYIFMSYQGTVNAAVLAQYKFDLNV